MPRDFVKRKEKKNVFCLKSAGLCGILGKTPATGSRVPLPEHAFQ